MNGLMYYIGAYVRRLRRHVLTRCEDQRQPYPTNTAVLTPEGATGWPWRDTSLVMTMASETHLCRAAVC